MPQLRLLFLLTVLCFACESTPPTTASNPVPENPATAPAPAPTSKTPRSENATFKSFDNQTIAYLDEGTGPPVLLLHGFINDGSAWNRAELKTQLLIAGYRVVIPDMRGNGNSAKPQNDEAYADNAEVKDLRALADHLKLETYAAVGYSRGAIVLAELLTQDDRISSAVIGGMGLDFTNPEWPRRLMFAEAFAGKTTPETEGAVDYAKSVKADLRALHLLQKHQPATPPAALRKVDIPILVIAGNEDHDNGDPGALERLFPNGKLAIVPGDHNNTYKSQVFAVAVMAFIKGN